MKNSSKQLILVGGFPGSGKTYVGQLLASEIGSFIDKDTISGFFAERLLASLGSHANDRESETYLNIVRPIEYKTMMAVAFENLESGQSAVCSAPFIKEFGDAQWIKQIQLETEIRGAELVLVWVDTDIRSAKMRIIERGAGRDNWKIEHWHEYVKSLPHNTPFCFDIHIINNSNLSSTSVLKQINDLIDLLRKTAKPSASEHMKLPDIST